MLTRKTASLVTPDLKLPDLKRVPYRGVVSEIAKEQGRTQQAVSLAIRCLDPEILEILALKCETRQREHEKRVSSAIARINKVTTGTLKEAA
jgi:hypothetical protein